VRRPDFAGYAKFRLVGLFVYSLEYSFLDLILSANLLVEPANEFRAMADRFQSKLCEFDIVQIF
jgi:hypothetical protein